MESNFSWTCPVTWNVHFLKREKNGEEDKRREEREDVYAVFTSFSCKQLTVLELI
jgi:hypothetical protein